MARPITQRAKRRPARFEYLFMRASGEELDQISTLVEKGALRPVLDRTFPFDQTAEAVAYVESGRAVGW